VTLSLLFIIGLGTGLSGAMIPGPLFLYTFSQSLKKDMAVGLRIALGHIMIEALFVALILIGFRGYLSSPGFLRVVTAIGGFGLIGMGIILLRGVKNMTLEVEQGIDFDYGSVVGGAFFSIISPGFLIWWTTIGFSVILQSLVSGLIGFATVAAGHWIADIGWHWFVSYFVHKGKHYLKDNVYHGMIRALAVGLMVMGAYFFTLQ